MPENVSSRFDITASIVLYKNDTNEVNKAINSFLNTKLRIKLFLVDNSPNDSLQTLASDPRVEYIFSNGNKGFGSGHNVALRKAKDIAPYHLVLNPDISF